MTVNAALTVGSPTIASAGRSAQRGLDVAVLGLELLDEKVEEVRPQLVEALKLGAAGEGPWNFAPTYQRTLWPRSISLHTSCAVIEDCSPASILRPDGEPNCHTPSIQSTSVTSSWSHRQWTK